MLMLNDGCVQRDRAARRRLLLPGHSRALQANGQMRVQAKGTVGPWTTLLRICTWRSLSFIIDRIIAMGQGGELPESPGKRFLNWTVSALTHTCHTDDVQERPPRPATLGGGTRRHWSADTHGAPGTEREADQRLCPL